MDRLPFVKSPLSSKNTRHGESVNENADLTTRDDTLFENPQFEHYEATSNLQLFFDLFFVANLTSFTNSHEVNSKESLASYVGFICILWFTWCQVTLYDVRFATDSLFERIAHACHFGVMVGLAVIGPLFLQDPNGWDPLQQLSLILMGSRIVLLCQYSTTLFFTWRFKQTRVPLLLVIASLAIAIIIYLGVSFAFYNQTSYDAYIAWYFVAVSEVVVNVSVAAIWPAVSLLKTHLAERMTCLTLIILGEGIIGLTKTIVKIDGMDKKFTSGDIGMIISAVLIIYIVYQLYFDNLSNGQALGSRRQHIWAILHFPFHLALCLMMEGTNQTLLWYHITTDLDSIFNSLSTAIDNESPTGLRASMSEIFTTVFSRFETTEEVFNEAQMSLNETLSLPADANFTEVISVGFTLITDSYKTVIEDFGWETPEETSNEGAEGFLESYDAILSVFNLTFGYFAVCTGLILIFISILSILSFNHKNVHHWLQYLSTAVNLLIGLGIVLLSTITLTSNAETLGESSWTLPVLMLILLALLVLHHLPRGRYRPVIANQD
ncbi:bacterial low temperature requirement A protein-domain-containing protein [Talaromyces proteolyticus]|uniref:Bacterial low temperature requirement A protein-domain-containing protein n=1 Tax=Talaromyces proteolyticus TaxID=1131652 RepID=A0AAD4KY05_9EURO|nr:bacterial low temperature requirement A protein-domain-containing protein [Talaromyces proteolyticus]KAH8698586.1 bacterial low temperature requirement A protein-domain-containing protein [Talaromyces proteolyticus]